MFVDHHVLLTCGDTLVLAQGRVSFLRDRNTLAQVVYVLRDSALIAFKLVYFRSTGSDPFDLKVISECFDLSNYLFLPQLQSILNKLDLLPRHPLISLPLIEHLILLLYPLQPHLLLPLLVHHLAHDLLLNERPLLGLVPLPPLVLLLLLPLHHVDHLVLLLDLAHNLTLLVRLHLRQLLPVLPLPDLLLHILKGKALLRIPTLGVFKVLHALLLGPDFSHQIVLTLFFTVFALLT